MRELLVVPSLQSGSLKVHALHLAHRVTVPVALCTDSKLARNSVLLMLEQLDVHLSWQVVTGEY